MLTVLRLAEIAGGRVVGDGTIAVDGVTHDSREVRAGDLFVALPGLQADGAEFVRDAVARGAVAVCAEADSLSGFRDLGVPVLLVADARSALADLSAAAHDYPARKLRLIGITGTLGKTSTAALLQAAMVPSSAGRGVGVVGSLGASVAGHGSRAEPGRAVDLDGMTTPDAPDLHRALRVLVDAGVQLAVMEVTSHALAQERVRGIELQLGVFTNLVPDEHLDFHGTADDYLRTKARFFDHMTDSAPLVFNAEDPLLRDMVLARIGQRRNPLVGVTLGAGPIRLAAKREVRPVSVMNVEWSARGSTFTLRFDEPLPRMDGGVVDPASLTISLPLLGVQLIANAALAAVAALVAGASHRDVTAALRRVAQVRRRMQVIWDSGPLVIDDTTGNPETLRAVFATARTIPRSELRVVFGLRGSRGVGINELLAAALADVITERAREEPVHLIVTWSDDVAGGRDRVTQEEREGALGVLRRELSHVARGVSFATEPSLQRAVQRSLAEARRDALVLLLGTQGMDRAAEFARAELGGGSGAPVERAANARFDARAPQ